MTLMHVPQRTLNKGHNSTVEAQGELHEKQKKNIEQGSRCKHEITQINHR